MNEMVKSWRQIIYRSRIPTSAPTCKDIGSHYCHLHHKKKKALKTENQGLFLDLSGNRGHRINDHPKTWRDRLIQRIHSSLPGAEAAGASNR